MEQITDPDALYRSMEKCKLGVAWKDSVRHFLLNDIVELIKLEDRLASGQWVYRPGKEFMITHPKLRPAMSICFKDRVFQRALNDNAVYPELTKHFIYDNCACQKKKGTDFCRNRLKCHLQRFYRKHGLDGYILKCDIQGYYPNMPHKLAENIFDEYLPQDVAEVCKAILRQQYAGDVGYLPGSQLLQLVGISALNHLDHFIKEKLHINHYVRYMDDFILIHEDNEYLEYCRAEIQKELDKIGFNLHPTKTKTIKVCEQFKFMGFLYRLTSTGKVLMFVDPKLVKQTRRKIRRIRKLEKSVEEVERSWLEYSSRGTPRVKRL